MEYEIAKQLKKEGWNQCKKDPNKDYYYPTLSELIKACGKRIEMLQQINDDLVNWKWEAHTESFCVVGSTPEEAVAKLWLELNKK